MCCAMLKHVFRHMLTAKAQISLCIHAVWSGPSLSTDRIIGYYRMFQWRGNAQMRICVCAGWYRSLHFEQTLRHFFTWCSSHIWHRQYHAKCVFIHIHTIFTISIQTSELLTVHILKFKQVCFLTHLCQVDSSTIPLWTGPFPVKGIPD